jgi:hypothetical protein
MKYLMILFLMGLSLTSCAALLPEMEHVAEEACLEEVEIVLEHTTTEIQTLKRSGLK